MVNGIARMIGVASWLPLLACASPGAQGTGQRGSAELEPADMVWASRIDRDHALVGRIWDVAAQRFVAEKELVGALASARFVVLGEKHDNPDHHLLQARLIEQLVARGRKPGVAFEMLDVERQPALERARAAHPGDPDALAAAVDWARSGWPAFELYRPLFAAALGADLPIAAAGLDRDAAMRLAREGTAALDAALAQRFALDVPLPAAADAALRGEMRDAHCGLMPDAMLGSLVLVQRARDAQFAERLHAAATRDGAVLVAGNGHARSDRGVPAQLARGRGAPALAIGLLEVQRAWRAPAEYAQSFAADRLPFDYVWFTPRASDTDPCAELRRKYGKRGS